MSGHPEMSGQKQLQAGTRLGPYELVAPIGAGGMGQVFRARDTRLEREVAVKLLPDDCSADPQFLARFEREARTISSLNHPHICTLHDVGEDGGVRFLVLELIEGESLADRLVRGRLAIDQVLRIGSQVASALDAAHRKGIVHRDLKPGNVMLTKTGAKLLDFGLAKSATADGGIVAGLTESPTQARPLTEQGTILGTFQYMAPEQLEGQDADARTDIFALGALLYEMATGRRAFEGKTRTSLIAAIVAGTPRPVSDLVPMTPPAFEHVVRRCLEKEPAQRWQSAHDVAEELRWIADAGSKAGLPAVVVRRWLRLDRVFAVALAASLVVIAVLAARGRRPADPPSQALTIPGMTEAYKRADAAIVSPDGTRIAFLATRKDGKRLLWVRRLDSFAAVALEGTDMWPTSSCWSPDSRELAFVAGGKLYRVSTESGAVQGISDVPVPVSVGLSWGSAGVILVGSTDAGIQKVKAAGGPFEPLTRPNSAAGERGHTHPTFLRDGRRFTYVAMRSDPGGRDRVSRLWLGSLDGPPREIGPVGSQALVDEESGQLLYVNGGTLVAVRFDTASATIAGEPVPILDDVSLFLATSGAGASLSATGVLTGQSNRRGDHLHWLDYSGRHLGVLEDVPVGQGFRFTADGKRVIAAAIDRKLGLNDLFSFDAVRTGWTRLTYGRFWKGAPVPSPDGTSVYYASSRKGPPDIYRKVLGSADEDQELLARAGYQFPVDVSPDGRFLLYSTNEDPAAQGDLWILPLAGGNAPRPFVRSPFDEGDGRFSPNGSEVAYTSNESGNVYVRPFPGPGSARQVSQGGGEAPRWSHDGRSLYFLSDGKLLRAREPFDAEPELLFENRNLVGFELAPDGKRILARITDDFEASPPIRILTNWRALLPIAGK